MGKLSETKFGKKKEFLRRRTEGNDAMLSCLSKLIEISHKWKRTATEGNEGAKKNNKS